MKYKAIEKLISSYEYILLVGIVSVLFLAQPFLAFVLLVMVCLQITDKQFGHLFLIALFGSCYLGLINVTKLPDSDYISYLNWFSNAQLLPLREFLLLNTREPLYYLGLHMIANFPYTSEQLFVFTSTVISYFIFLLGVIRLSIFLDLRYTVIIIFTVALIFFAPLFSLSAHLMRQFIAASLVILFFSEFVITAKKNWFILLAAILIHYSVIIFLPIALMKKNEKFSSGLSIVAYLSLLPVVYFASRIFAYLFEGVPVLGFVFSRIAANEGHDLGHLSVVAILFSIAMLFISLMNLNSSKHSVQMKGYKQIWVINVGAFCMGLIVLVANMQSELTEIATRFYFYLYFFMGLTIPILMVSRRKPLLLSVYMLALSIPYFFYKSQFGEWQFASLKDLLISPSWQLWIYRV